MQVQTFHYQAITKMPQYQNLSPEVPHRKSPRIKPPQISHLLSRFESYACTQIPRLLQVHDLCPPVQELRYADYKRGTKGTAPSTSGPAAAVGLGGFSGTGNPPFQPVVERELTAPGLVRTHPPMQQRAIPACHVRAHCHRVFWALLSAIRVTHSAYLAETARRRG